MFEQIQMFIYKKHFLDHNKLSLIELGYERQKNKKPKSMK